MELYDLLKRADVNPEKTLVLRHRPIEPELRKTLPWLAAEKPEVYNAYQQLQSPRVEKQMMNAEYVASFIGDKPGRALFVGLYEVYDYWPVTHHQRSRIAAHRELLKLGTLNGQEVCQWFDLRLSETFSAWQGKLVIDWPGRELSWSRWAKKDSGFAVSSILDESLLIQPIPNWRELNFTWEELQRIPQSWRAALREWRGIYFIFDTKAKQGYVGAAYGTDNILGRWLAAYAKTGHGGNKKLKLRSPEAFRFSILERLSPDTPTADVIDRERSWKKRLHTREFGLNDN